MLGQISRVSSTHQNNEYILYKHMSGNEWFFSLIESFQQEIARLCNILLATDIIHNTKCYQINDCDFLLFIEPHSQQMLGMSSTRSMHAWTCLITECRILSEWTGKDVEGSSLALFRILFRDLHDGTWRGWGDMNVNQGGHCPGWHSIPAPLITSWKRHLFRKRLGWIVLPTGLWLSPLNTEGVVHMWFVVD